MRLSHPDGSVVHLAYCTNVHPAEDLDGVRAQLRDVAARVRERLGVDRLGVGLWLPADLAHRLDREPAVRTALRRSLDDSGLEVVTLNGFPYRGFHDAVVKRRVYRPDWREPARLHYTLALARTLTELLPDDVGEGSISTLPLGWRTGWDAVDTETACANLRTLGEELRAIGERTGRRIRVAFEPEPGCIIETVAQVDTLLSDTLGGAYADVLGVCTDLCHHAVQFGEADDIAALRTPIIKAQVSAGLRLPAPAGAAAERVVADFDEPRFLHQVRARTAAGIGAVDDLSEVGALPDDVEWRVHFHVPVTATPGTTQQELCASLGVLVGGAQPLVRHLEVETYTWNVLPPDRRPADLDGLVAGIADELAWTRDQFHRLTARSVT